MNNKKNDNKDITARGLICRHTADMLKVVGNLPKDFNKYPDEIKNEMQFRLNDALNCLKWALNDINQINDLAIDYDIALARITLSELMKTRNNITDSLLNNVDGSDNKESVDETDI